MSKIFPGRYTVTTDEPFTVFLIGMRINKLWAVHKWWPVSAAMGPMIAELSGHPEKGYLGGYTLPMWRGVVMVQYWRSFAHLEAFARNQEDPHLSAWKRFNQAIGDDGSVGVWHETYVIEPGKFENIYVNMPRFGLGRALDHGPVLGRRHTARKRLQAAEAPEPA